MNHRLTGSPRTTTARPFLPGANKALLIFALLILAFYAFMEIAIGVAWWLYLGLALVFALALIQRRPYSLQKDEVHIFIAVTSFMALMWIIPLSPREQLARNLAKVRPGMSESEVRHIMHGHVELRPETGKTLLYRHHYLPDYDADWASVTFLDGKVSECSFYTD
jgi:hypothetical protein